MSTAAMELLLARELQVLVLRESDSSLGNSGFVYLCLTTSPRMYDVVQQACICKAGWPRLCPEIRHDKLAA